jgi:hypothetical protein
LTDVGALDRAVVLHDLFIMAVALCVGAAVIGIVAGRLNKMGIGPDLLLGGVAGSSGHSNAVLLRSWIRRKAAVGDDGMVRLGARGRRLAAHRPFQITPA